MDRRAPDRTLGPTLSHRLAQLTRPNWARTIAARRVAAALLAALAVALFFRGDPDSQHVPVVVASHDLSPGHVIEPDDVRTVAHESGSAPDGVIRDPNAVLGRTLAGATRKGQTLTDIAVIGPRLAAVSVGTADARIVPVRLADAGFAELLREGDRVDVLTAGSDPDSHQPAATTPLATDAAVVLVSQAKGGRGGAERVVMLALPAPAASAVAIASLTNALTVVLR